MDATKLIVDIRVLFSVIAGASAVVIYIVSQFFRLEKMIQERDLGCSEVSGINKKEHEELRMRVSSIEKEIVGFGSLLAKIDKQAEIQTNLLVKMGELTTHMDHVKTRQNEIAEDLNDLKQKIDEMIRFQMLKDEQSRRGRE